MTTKSLFQLAIQLCGLYFVYEAIFQFLKTLGLIFTPNSQRLLALPKEYIFFQIFALALYVLVAFALLFLARPISQYFSHKGDDQPIPLKKHDIIEVVIIGLGIVNIVSLIPTIYPVISTFDSITNSGAFYNLVISIGLNSILIWKGRLISEYIMKINAVSKKEDN